LEEYYILECNAVYPILVYKYFGEYSASTFRVEEWAKQEIRKKEAASTVKSITVKITLQYMVS
jgi:hypothetical protein